jgi:glutathione synthase
MKIAMFVNEIASEVPEYTTTWLAREATARGHEVWYVEVEGFAYDPDEMVRAKGRRVPEGGKAKKGKGKEYEDGKSYLEALRGEDGIEEWVEVSALDVLMLRNDPSISASEHRCLRCLRCFSRPCHPWPLWAWTSDNAHRHGRTRLV